MAAWWMWRTHTLRLQASQRYAQSSQSMRPGDMGHASSQTEHTFVPPHARQNCPHCGFTRHDGQARWLQDRQTMMESARDAGKVHGRDWAASTHRRQQPRRRALNLSRQASWEPSTSAESSPPNLRRKTGAHVASSLAAAAHVEFTRLLEATVTSLSHSLRMRATISTLEMALAPAAIVLRGPWGRGSGTMAVGVRMQVVVIVSLFCSGAGLDAVPLHIDNYDELVTSGPEAWVFEVSSRRCETCRTFAPEWDAAVAALPAVRIGHVDVDEPKGKALAKKLQALQEVVQPCDRLLRVCDTHEQSHLPPPTRASRW